MKELLEYINGLTEEQCTMLIEKINAMTKEELDELLNGDGKQ